jgi:hypothetical protein
MLRRARGTRGREGGHERYSRPRITSRQIRLDWSTRNTGLLSESRHLISPPPRNSMTVMIRVSERWRREWGGEGLTHVDLLIQLVVYDF